MKKFYFTWGFDQTYRGKSMKFHYTIIQAKDDVEARLKMIDRFGTEWGFQYNSADDAGVNKWRLIYFPFEEQFIALN